MLSLARLFQIYLTIYSAWRALIRAYAVQMQFNTLELVKVVERVCSVWQ